MPTEFYSHGKLLLTSEYLVLDGAKALALPTKLGQKMIVEKTDANFLKWKSYTHEGKCWFEQEYELKDKQLLPIHSKTETSEIAISERLQQIFQLILKKIPSLFEKSRFEIETHLEFPQDWGLGSSSTLINNLASWSKTDPYLLLRNSFGGSGYDIACADASGPIIFQLNEEEKPKVKTVEFDPSFKDQLFFVHLNQKQNSRKAIQHYREQLLSNKDFIIEKANQLTESLLHADNLSEFENTLEDHEQMLSKLLQLPTVKERLFPDYPKTLKSLGGWGGDFILASGAENEKDYFKTKGYTTILAYEQLIL